MLAVVEAARREGVDVTLDEFDIWIFAASDRDQFRADVETDARVAGTLQEIAEHARPATEIDHAGTALGFHQPNAGIDQAQVAFRREHVVGALRSVAVEERYFFVFVLR